MKSDKKLWMLAELFILAVIFAAGCAEQEKPKKVELVKPEKVEQVKVEKAEPVKVEKKPATHEPITLLLKFKEGDMATYRATAEVEKSLDFSGEISKDPEFRSGKAGDRAEMEFAEQIENVDQQGNATAKITIKQLKYISKERNIVHLDFDSSREKDKADELNKLIGQSYTVTISPKGDVLNVTGGEEIKALVAGNLPSSRFAANLVSQDMIRKRHQIAAMADANDRPPSIGDKWNGRKKVSFAQMGVDVYEKIYTLKDIESKGGQEIAVVEITAIPVARVEQGSSPMMNMFDNVREFGGELRLDLTKGRVEKYYEKMNSQWVVADPQTAEEGKELSTIKMGYMQLYSLERVD
jgi:hypothetical protein